MMKKVTKLFLLTLAASSVVEMVALSSVTSAANMTGVFAGNTATQTESNIAKVENFDGGDWNFKAIGFETSPALVDQSVWAAGQTAYSYNHYFTLTDPYGNAQNITSFFNYGQKVFFNYNSIDVKGYIFDIPADTSFAGDNSDDTKDINLHFTNEQKFICKLENGGLGEWTPFVAPTSFKLSATKQDVAVGDTYQIVPEVETTEENPLVFYKSSDETIATIDANGLVSALGAGDVTITAYCNGLSASMTVHCAATKTVTSIRITNENKTLHVGQGNDWKLWLSDIHAKKVFDDNTEADIVLTADMFSGEVDAETIGQYPLTLTVDGCTDTLTISIDALTAIDWNADGALAGVDNTGWGGAFQICIGTIYDRAQYVNLPADLVAKVKEHILVNGEPMDVTGVKNLGGARYIVYGNYSPSANDVVTLKQGLRIYQYSGTADGNHAPVGDGGFYAIQELKADRRLVYSAATKSFTPWTIDATDFSISAPRSYLSVGGELDLTVTYTPEDAYGVIEWSSSDSAIATVSNQGVVTGVAEGNVTIHAKMGDVEKTMDLTVTPAKAIKGIAFVDGPATYYRAVGSDTSFVPSATKGKFVFEDDSLSPEFDLDANNFVAATIDTSKAADLSVDVGYKVDETTYTATVQVKVYEYAEEKVKEVAIVDWFDYCVFIECDQTATNTANFTDDATSQYYQDHISWTHKDGTKVSFSAYVLGAQIALFPEFNYKDGEKIVNKDNYETLYQKGDKITISAGTGYYKWTGNVADPGGASKPVEGTGEQIIEGKFSKDITYRYGQAGWASYVATTELVAKSDSVTVEVGKTVRSGISRGPEGATSGTLTFVSSDPTIAKVAASGNITGLKAGTCTVTANWVDDDDPSKTLTKTITVTVTEPDVPSSSEDVPSSSEEPTPTPTPDKPAKKGLSTGAIVGITIGSVAVVLAAVLSVVLVKKHKKNKK